MPALTCRLCFTRTELDKMKFVCLEDECRSHEHEDLFHAISGERHEMGIPMRWTTVQERQVLACPQCHNSTTRYAACPRCMNVFSKQEIENPVNVLTISLTGPRSAGKTVYMVGLIETLARFAASNGGKLFPIGSTQHDYNEQYYRRVFSDGQTPPPTPEGRQKTLHYDLMRADGSRVGISISDVGGETIEALTEPVPELDYINNCDLSIFLFDPYGVQTITNRLQGVVSIPESVGQPAEEVISTVLTNLINPQNNHTKFALLFGKFDIIRSLRDSNDQVLRGVLANLGNSFFTDDTFTPNRHWNEEESLIHDADVRALLQVLGGGEVVRNAELSYQTRPHLLRAFAVSALGSPPGGAYLNRCGVTPFRCLDPLRWAYRHTFNEQLMGG